MLPTEIKYSDFLSFSELIDWMDVKPVQTPEERFMAECQRVIDDEDWRKESEKRAYRDYLENLPHLRKRTPRSRM